MICLKDNFNKIAKEKSVKILSIVEGQKVDGIAKIVDNASATCDLGDKFEEVHILDYDHLDICKPADITDRRYTDYHTFITTKVYDPTEDLVVYGKGEEPQTRFDDDDDDDEKEGFGNDDTRTFVVDPSEFGLSAKYIKMQELQKNPDMKSFTSVLAEMFREEAENMKLQNIKNSFQSDVMAQNKKILENLLTTKEFIKDIDQSRIKKSVDLSMRYWDLLQESKGIIRLKKDQIDTLLDYCSEWKNILEKQIEEKRNGKDLDEDEIEFVELVRDELKQWFEDKPEIEEIKGKWRKLLGELEYVMSFSLRLL